MAIEAHRGGETHFVQKCTDDYVAMMQDKRRWGGFDGKMAAVGSFPIGVNQDDPRLAELKAQISAYLE
ncbi:MAG: hypothetical protein R3A44_44270 [Caldilineaceae bacterium]